ncbi:precorrin-3B C(17)-methyltransferase [Cyanobium sp. CH-040]|uniref:precorrin-3B C(17)-methyltransferase n=1 Tax=Cyanobium sp. CH-040 TaxID=2823708 RepID=UPI0020CFA242|nr:precorrin-3B C(17)-methyltransferase [Cyanobium sp. CH-040]MCP9928561.1 precorrin-3B C(17)-methyltransferase [Cyanobium sp. CH-040]
MNRQGVWGLSFSPGGEALLEPLRQAGLIDQPLLLSGEPRLSASMAEHWSQARGFVVVGACGLVVRLVAPLLASKQEDPAVVVLDPQGRYAIPLLGGHQGGAERLAQLVAAVLGAGVVSTGSSSGRMHLPLDSFGRDWGWRRAGATDAWSALMKQAAQPEAGLRVSQDAGCRLWQRLEASRQLTPIEALQPEEPPPADLAITIQQGPGCRWHPPSLWLGLGCERHTSLALLERLVDGRLRDLNLAPQAVAGVASIDRKADEPALLALASRRGWPLRWFPAAELAAVAVPNPSAVVAAEMGTASVAEASALLAAGPAARLLAGKQVERAMSGEQGAATLAIALAGEQWLPKQGQLHLVGSGPGRLDLLTPDARRALAGATVWVGYGLYLDLLEPLRRPDQLRWDGRLTEEEARCGLALDLASQGLNVALVSSGDSGIYAMAGLALDLWLRRPADGRPAFTVHPGLSALQLAAARVGAPLMHDFCTVSLSDRLTPWGVIERRLRAAAAGDFVVALYNPRSRDRHWQLERARELLLAERPSSTPVVVARQLGRPQEQVTVHTLDTLPVEEVDMLTLVLVGNSTSRSSGGWVVTPRGYPGAEITDKSG